MLNFDKHKNLSLKKSMNNIKQSILNTYKVLFIKHLHGRLNDREKYKAATYTNPTNPES